MAKNKALEDKQLWLQVWEGSNYGREMSLHFVPYKINQNLQSSFVSWLHNLPISLGEYL